MKLEYAMIALTSVAAVVICISWYEVRVRRAEAKILDMLGSRRMHSQELLEALRSSGISISRGTFYMIMKALK